MVYKRVSSVLFFLDNMVLQQRIYVTSFRTNKEL